MKIGNTIKVHVPGEWPWATVLKIISETVIQARLENDLVTSAGKVGDVLTFQWRDLPAAPGSFAWELSPPHEQLTYGPKVVEHGAVPPAYDENAGRI